MTLQKPVIPATVTDQIRLWELERDRFRFADGVLYSQFLCQKDFELLRDHARVCILLYDSRLFIIIYHYKSMSFIVPRPLS